jgi:hypothetical protein
MALILGMCGHHDVLLDDPGEDPCRDLLRTPEDNLGGQNVRAEHEHQPNQGGSGRLTRRKFETYAADRQEPVVDSLIKAGLRFAGGRFKHGVWNESGFGLHRVTMLGSASTQPFLDCRIEVADCDAVHRDGFACPHRMNVVSDAVDVMPVYAGAPTPMLSRQPGGTLLKCDVRR